MTFALSALWTMSSTGTPVESYLLYSNGNGSISNDFSNHQLQSNWMFNKALLMYKVWPVTLCAIGAPLNLLSLIIFLQPTMRKFSTSIYLCVLAIFDQLVLVTNALVMISEFYNTDLMTRTFCKTTQFLYSFGGHTASWLIILVSTERLMVTAYPLKTRTIRTRRNGCIACVGLIIAFAIINLHMFWTIDIKIGGPSLKRCAHSTMYRSFHQIWIWLDIALLSFAPCVILLTLNAIIIMVMRKTVRLMRRLTNDAPRDIPAGGVYSRQITSTLIVVSIFFLICSFPFAILYLYRHVYWETRFETHVEEHALYLLVHQTLRMIHLCNNACNFFLYALIGRKFRREFLTVFTCGKRPAFAWISRATSFRLTKFSTTSIRENKTLGDAERSRQKQSESFNPLLKK